MKMMAGADFVQTQCIYNLDKFKVYLEDAKRQGLHEKVKILAGVTPLKSAGMAKFMKKMVAGMDIPDAVIKRIADEPKEKQSAKGIEMCIELIHQLKEMEGIAGVHVMAIEWEENCRKSSVGLDYCPAGCRLRQKKPQDNAVRPMEERYG